MTFDEAAKVYGVPSDRLTLWIGRGYVRGTVDSVDSGSLEGFLRDTDYAGYNSVRRSVSDISVAYRQFSILWTDVLGPEMSDMLRECLQGRDMTGIARDYGISLSTLQHYIRTASERLKRHFSDVPALRHRLAEALLEKRKAAVAQSPVSQENELSYILRSNAHGSERFSEKEIDHAYDQLVRILYTPVGESGLSVRCVNAALKSGISTLFDFIVVHKACGRSGMLTKLTHFGAYSFDEVQSLLVRLNLVSVKEDDRWESPADVLVDTESELYVRYSQTAKGRGLPDKIRGRERVAEWIGSYMSAVKGKDNKK